MRRVQPIICRNWPDERWKLFGSWSCFHASSTNLIAGSTTSCFHCKRNFFFSEGSVQSEGNVDHCGIVRMLNPRARFLAALIQVSSVEANALTTMLATGCVGDSVNIRARDNPMYINKVLLGSIKFTHCQLTRKIIQLSHFPDLKTHAKLQITSKTH